MYRIFVFCGMWISWSIGLNAEIHSSTKESQLEQHFESFQKCIVAAGTHAENIISKGSGEKYEKRNWQWNSLNGHVMPMAFVVAKNVSDVQNAVICGKSSKIRTVPRSGGHNYLKYGFGDSESVIIDLSHFNQVLPNPENMTCEIGPGARAGRITTELWRKGKFLTTTALNPSVGSGGSTLGGGYGHFARIYGLACDNLIELEMVDAIGQLLVINEHVNPDLFWALRGGGGGNFGVVTKMKFKMYEAPKSITYASITFSLDDFALFYDAWQCLMESERLDSISGYALKQNNIIILMIYHISSESVVDDRNVMKIENLLKDFHFPSSTSKSIEIISLAEFLLLDAKPQFKTEIKQLSQLSDMDEYLGWKKVKSFYVAQKLSKKSIEELDALIKPFHKQCSWIFEMNGGAINKFNTSETAFIHRGKNMFHVQLKFIDENGEHPDLEGVSAMNTFYDRTKVLLSHRESYQNYMDGDISDYLERYYGTNLKRLIEIKKKFDPENLFHHPRSIPTEFNYHL